MVCRFGVIGFSLKEQVYTKLCHCSLIYLAEAEVKLEWDVDLTYYLI